MNLSALIKLTSTGFLVGFLAGNRPELGSGVLPLVALVTFISIIMVLFEVTNLEPAAPAIAASAQAV